MTNLSPPAPPSLGHNLHDDFPNIAAAVEPAFGGNATRAHLARHPTALDPTGMFNTHQLALGWAAIAPAECGQPIAATINRLRPIERDLLQSVACAYGLTLTITDGHPHVTAVTGNVTDPAVHARLRRALRGQLRHGGITRRCPSCRHITLTYLTGPIDVALTRCNACGGERHLDLTAEPAHTRRVYLRYREQHPAS